MSDRLSVYKTPVQRFLETSLILLAVAGIAALAHVLVPELPAGYVAIGSLALGWALVPRLGSRLAERRGAPMLSFEQHSRRYLAELRPLGLAARPGWDQALAGRPRRRREPGRG